MSVPLILTLLAGAATFIGAFLGRTRAKTL